MSSSTTRRRPAASSKSSPPGKPVHKASPPDGGKDRSYGEYEPRLLDNGQRVLIKVVEGFIIPGKDHEVGDAGFEYFQERVMHMLAVFEASSDGATVVSAKCERQDPRPPYAKVVVRLPEYYLPRP